MPRFRPFLLGFLFVVLAAAVPVSAGNNRWTLHGPAGGSVDRMVIDPVDPSIVYAATFNGLFRSADGGQTWTFARPFLGKIVGDVAVASAAPQKVFASAGGLYASVDRGQTWFQRHSSGSFAVATSADGTVVYSAGIDGVRRSSNGGATFGLAGVGLPSAFSVETIVLDPANPDTLWAALASHGVYKSIDGGAHWTSANTGPATSAVYSLTVDPTNPATLYAGGNGALFKSTNGGTSWSPLATGQPSTVYRAVAVSRSSPSTVVAGTDRGVLKSTNGGSSWTGAKLVNATIVAVDPLDPNVILAVAARSVFRSTDGGTTYAVTGRGLTAQSVDSIAADPRNAAVVYASGSGGVFKSSDRGLTWTAPASSETQPAGPSTSDLVVDPFNSSTLYGIQTIFVRRSLNGGATWAPFGDGLPSGAALHLIADPQTAGVLYAVSSGTFYRKNGAAPWTAVGSIPASFVSFLTIDPSNPATLYAGANESLYKSVNGGVTWNAFPGIPGFTPSGVAVDPFDSNHLFTWYLDAYESTDGGASFTPVRTIDGPVAFDPAVPGRVYATDFNGVRRSTDGGKTWISLRDADGEVDTRILLVAPDGQSVYAGGIFGGVWTYHLGRRRAVRH
jgi:photosystem II stability/assembly factor-like uncharacterized protein